MYEPLFAHLLHIRPWEIDLLTAEQFNSHVEWIESYLKDQQGGGGGG